MIGKQVLRVNLRNKIPCVKLTHRKRLELLVIHGMHILFSFPMQIKFDLKKRRKKSFWRVGVGVGGEGIRWVEWGRFGKFFLVYKHIY